MVDSLVSKEHKMHFAFHVGMKSALKLKHNALHEMLSLPFGLCHCVMNTRADRWVKIFIVSSHAPLSELNA